MSFDVSVLLVALGTALVLMTVYRRRNGRFAMVSADRTAGEPTPTAPATTPATSATSATPVDERQRLSDDDVGAPLGELATLVQFSSAFCAPCRAARTLLGSIADRHDGVAYVDVDAESHLQLVRELGVLRTPTILVLDRSGAIVTRTSGLPRRADVDAVLRPLVNS